MRTPDCFNEARGLAYALSDEGALAQLACTGMLQPVFYATPEAQQRDLLSYGARVSPGFLARTALYARRHGLLKETPALLCALLAQRDGALLQEIFHEVIDTGPMLRKFVGYLRGGEVGRRSLGRRPRELVHEWFARRTDEQLLWASVGNAPSLADVLRLAHVRPGSPEREAFFRYLLGRKVADEALPECARALRRFQRTGLGPVPDVPFQLLTAVRLSPRVWTALARKASWTMTRMNLNTFARHGVFDDTTTQEIVAERLADLSLLRKARAMPFQLLTARKSLDAAVPTLVRKALSRAVDLSLENVPELPGKVWLCVDVSGSMSSSISRLGTTRCVDVAALFAAALLRKNVEAKVIVFDTSAHPLALDPHQPVMRLATQITHHMGGGTDCSAPLRLLNDQGLPGDLVVVVSDQESWAAASRRSYGGQTSFMGQWRRFLRRCPQARLVCLDLQPYASVQAPPSWDVLHVGGFSDEVFRVLGRFVQGKLGPDAWVSHIQAQTLYPSPSRAPCPSRNALVITPTPPTL